MTVLQSASGITKCDSYYKVRRNKCYDHAMKIKNQNKNYRARVVTLIFTLLLIFVKYLCQSHFSSNVNN